MKKRTVIPKETVEAQYYDRHGILKEMIDEPMEMSLKTELRRSIPPCLRDPMFVKGSSSDRQPRRLAYREGIPM
jgi:hypothetical protein